LYDYQKDYKINYYNEHGMNGKMNNWYLSLTCFINSYPERRTIVRQGERAACFYIILSGSAIPTYKRATDGNIETLNVLKRGCTFGVRWFFV
jgi:CRP-like cAMP-binding protein